MFGKPSTAWRTKEMHRKKVAAIMVLADSQTHRIKPGNKITDSFCRQYRLQY
jgi:hypothetical protein